MTMGVLAEPAVRAAAASALIAISPLAIVGMDSDGRLLEFNAAAEELSGYRGDDVLGRDMPSLLVPERQRSALRAHIAAYLATGDPGEYSGRVRISLLRADGTERAVELLPARVTAGGQTTFWGVLREVTHAEELRGQPEQILAVASHELRTPLTSILSFAELLRGEADGLGPDGLHFLDVIERNADRLHRLTGDLMVLSGLESGMLPLDLTAISIPALVSEAVRAAVPIAAQQDVTIHLDASDGPSARGDYRRLLQVFDNLIGNAVKFSHGGGLVRITAACEGDFWRIDVSDAGIGIPPDEVGRLFTPFVRGSNARVAGVPGSGLGLSVVKAIIDRHHGRVDVDSRLAAGTTFTVRIPLVPR